jgi:hypothetical protein
MLLDRVFTRKNPKATQNRNMSKPHPAFWSCTMWPVTADERRVRVVIRVTETAQFHKKMLAMNDALTRTQSDANQKTELIVLRASL